MTSEKGKPAHSSKKVSSSGYRAEQGTDTTNVVNLLTDVLKSMQEQVERRSQPILGDAAQRAVDEYREISEDLRAPTRKDEKIRDPNWKLPPLNSRARD